MASTLLSSHFAVSTRPRIHLGKAANRCSLSVYRITREAPKAKSLIKAATNGKENQVIEPSENGEVLLPKLRKGEKKSTDGMWWWKECLPFLAMVLVQLGYAGMNVLSKAAMDSGMTPYVLVTYRQIFATVVIAPFAFFLERATLNVFLYFIGLRYTTPTIACAADNTFPAITYTVGIIVGMEKLKIKGRAGQAKVFGTCICVAGAMLLSFYHGPALHVPPSGIHWKFVQGTTEKVFGYKSSFLGPILVIGAAVYPGLSGLWFRQDTKLSQNYPAPLTNTTLMCFWSIFPSMLVSVAINHKPSDWSLKQPIRLVSVLYAAIVSSAIGICLMSWVVGKKGPLYVSIFSPLLLVIVAVLSWALLGEQLFVGTLLGSILIVTGLYIVLWGKRVEEMEDPPSTIRSEEEGLEDMSQLTSDDQLLQK